MGRTKNKANLPIIATLTPKQQKFVRAKANGLSEADAAREAGYSCPTEINARAQGTQVMNKPRVRQALSELLEDQFPMAKKDAANALQRILRGTSMQSIEVICPHCQKSSSHEIEQVDVSKDSNVLKAIDTLVKITGDYAPTKSAKLVANLDRYKLPEE